MSDSNKEDRIHSNPTSTSATTPPLPTSATKQPSLYFFWGADDHWISNDTRDAVVASRAAIPPSSTSSINASSSSAPRTGPKMEIDQKGLPHDFCTTDKGSAMVVDKVAEYVRDVLGSRHNVDR